MKVEEIKEIIMETKKETNELKEFITELEEWEETFDKIYDIFDGSAYVTAKIFVGSDGSRIHDIVFPKYRISIEPKENITIDELREIVLTHLPRILALFARDLRDWVIEKKEEAKEKEEEDW